MGNWCRTIYISGFLLVFFYYEFLTYWLLPFTWLKQPECFSGHCKKLLLVADPQIVGNEWNGLFFMDWIAIFDSDRYLKQTFAQSLNFIQPDIIIFLGDLMDQGFSAPLPDFMSYISRLKTIFYLPKSLQIIHVPGDNDIGGEDDILVPSSVIRFSKTFNESNECILADAFEICSANAMTYQIQHAKHVNADTIRIALSHVPLIKRKGHFLNEVIQLIKPHLIISGHVHRSSHYITLENDLWTTKHKAITPEEKNVNVFKFQNGVIHEIVVPTCSYRMGVPNMGYGALYIDTKLSTVFYNVLWLPHRFQQLFIYLSLIVIFALIEFSKFFRRITRIRICILCRNTRKMQAII